MPRALHVANHLIELAAGEPEPLFLTNLQLQKLLYYVQGWTLAMGDRPMFDEPIEAWKNGPVVPEVYRAFKHCGKLPIPHAAPGDSASLIETH